MTTVFTWDFQDNIVAVIFKAAVSVQVPFGALAEDGWNHPIRVEAAPHEHIFPFQLVR